MARYLLLICGDEGAWAARSEQERQRVVDGHAAFMTAAGAAALSAEELEPSTTAR